jgi:hypothetical protein
MLLPIFESDYGVAGLSVVFDTLHVPNGGID